MVHSRPLAALVVLASLLSSTGAVAKLFGCPQFPPHNVWNTPIDTLQVNASSAAWVTTIGSGTALHPDFGSDFGIPFTSVPGTQAKVPITFDEEAADESDPGPYPIPANAPIEGGADSDGDRHVLIVDRDNCKLYELDAAFPDSGTGGWDAYSGATFDLRSNALRPSTWTSADAAGLPILPGLVRYDEVMVQGEVNHAIRFTAPQTLNQFIWPARHQAGAAGASRPPMGARFRLKASFDISTFDPHIQAILKAFKKYGLILADNGSSWFFQGEPNALWDDDMLDALKTLHGSDFEAVDTAPLMIDVDSGDAFQPPPAVSLRAVASGLSTPLEIANARDGSGRLFVVQKGGVIRVVKNGALLATPFLDLSALVSTTSEEGLLGLAFDPLFTTNHRFFVYYTRLSDGAIQVSSFLVSSGNPDVANAASESHVIGIAHPGQQNHNGGHILFGPDGYLYIGTGDGGGAGDTPNNAQNTNVLLGKMLRIDVSGASGYTIPPTNPFVSSGGLAEIWALGLRNPWRYSFDRLTGDLYIGDVGQDTTEEIDYVPAGTAAGRNFGWRQFEGTHCFNPATGCSVTNYWPPVLTYGHTNGNNSIIGGYVYRGRKSRVLNGAYIYGDDGSSNVWIARHQGSTWSSFTFIPSGGLISGLTTFGEDEAGELYAASAGNGTVYALDPAGPPMPRPVMDFDGDEKSDLLWAHTDGRAAIWIMGGITPASTQEIIGAGTGWSVTQVADFDADGKGDLVWQHTDGRVAVYLMDGATPKATQQLLNAGGGWSVAQAADLDGDGKADLVFRNTDGRVAVWLMNGTTMTASAEIIGAGTGWSVTKVGDFDGDGKADLLFTHTDGRVAIWLMNGTSVKATAQILNAGSGWSVAQVADLDGDGRSDIVWQHTDGSTAAWLMNGTTLVAGAGLLGAGTGWSVAGAGDFNGDGKTDLFWANADGRAAIWLMNGLTPTTQTQILNAGGGWSLARLGDLDGDGKADIVWRNTDGRVAAWLMNGTTMSSGAGILGAATGWSVSTASSSPGL
ncbi:MAG TPA: FG-GAP-like repeat-containing protein [Usitatibacter sp.]|nr:FG-GAP-like repeat-containing protein [Usitatibacter sp.]